MSAFCTVEKAAQLCDPAIIAARHSSPLADVVALPVFR